MKQKTFFQQSVVWCIILVINVLLLAGIGWVAFGNKGVNEPTETTGRIIMELQKFRVKTDADPDGPWDLTHGEYSALLTSMIQEATKASRDQQTFAAHSFHIVLGAILGFLSASATMVFQGTNGKAGESDTPPGADGSDEGT
ncbi:hypothetical protein [Desulfoluna spongiiphila]|uniref:hypothetical protein n=1 Tax=Desulfoluna spongiiphila TaxID=419481 RepID=UPI0012597732|nr:hypothetical protein [Desulfoluna spongiiphila]VVS95092.1 consensus disorder prediction [Desulfoluna spongiiphila]